MALNDYYPKLTSDIDIKKVVESVVEPVVEVKEVKKASKKKDDK